MKPELLTHYLQFSSYTFPWCYQEVLKNHLPDDIEEIGYLLRKNIIHRSTLEMWNIESNEDLRFWDMEKVPWFRQPEDDVFPTAWAMLTELYRRDSRWFTLERKEENKLIVTCRYVSILMASILKSKGVPTRVRSWNAPYFTTDGFSWDHWINEYFDTKTNSWVTIDVDGSLSTATPEIDPYNLPKNAFDFPAKTWLDIRNGKDSPFRFKNGKPETGIIVVLWSLFYDFHCLMNNELLYIHLPKCATYQGFWNISPEELQHIDALARLMIESDENFEALQMLFQKKEFRLVYGGLI